MVWGSAIRAMPVGLGIELDRITDTCELDWAAEGFDVAAFSSLVCVYGGVAGQQFGGAAASTVGIKLSRPLADRGEALEL